MDLAIVTALANFGGLGLLAAVLFFLLLRQLNLFDKHMTALVGRLASTQEEVAEMKGDVADIRDALATLMNALDIRPALRIVRPEEPTQPPGES